jgi:hypothetical protein
MVPAEILVLVENFEEIWRLGLIWFLDDCPGRAVVLGQAQTAVGALGGIDDVLRLTFDDGSGGTFIQAAAALNAILEYFVSHD